MHRGRNEKRHTGRSFRQVYSIGSCRRFRPHNRRSCRYKCGRRPGSYCRYRYDCRSRMGSRVCCLPAANSGLRSLQNNTFFCVSFNFSSKNLFILQDGSIKAHDFGFVIENWKKIQIIIKKSQIIISGTKFLIEILRIFRRSKSREALQVQRFPAFVFQGTRGILPGLKSTGKKTVEPRHIYPLFVEKILSFEMDAKNRRPGRLRQTAPWPSK